MNPVVRCPQWNTKKKYHPEHFSITKTQNPPSYSPPSAADCGATTTTLIIIKVFIYFHPCECVIFYLLRAHNTVWRAAYSVRASGRDIYVCPTALKKTFTRRAQCWFSARNGAGKGSSREGREEVADFTTTRHAAIYNINYALMQFCEQFKVIVLR